MREITLKNFLEHAQHPAVVVSARREQTDEARYAM